MATKTFYLVDALAGTSNHLSLQDGGSAPVQARITTGWVVGTVAPTKYARMDSQTERASTSLASGAEPSSGPDNTLGDCFRSENPISGVFASGQWSFSFQVEGDSRSTGSHDGTLTGRIWKSANQDGSSPVEIGSGTFTTSAFTNLANTAFQTLTATQTLAEATLNNEYLFIQVALCLTGAGGNVNCDVMLAVGSSNSITTTNFVASANNYIETGSSRIDACINSGADIFTQPASYTETGSSRLDALISTGADEYTSSIQQFIEIGNAVSILVSTAPDLYNNNFPTNLVLDSFNRADEDPLNSTNWGNPFSNSMGSWKVLSNQAVPSGGG